VTSIIKSGVRGGSTSSGVRNSVSVANMSSLVKKTMDDELIVIMDVSFEVVVWILDPSHRIAAGKLHELGVIESGLKIKKQKRRNTTKIKV